MDPTQGPRPTATSSTEVNNVGGQPISTTNSETSLNNMLNPVDRHLPNYSPPSGWPTYISSSAHDFQSRSWWSSGESSSRLRPSHQANDVGLKTDHQLYSEGIRFHSGYGLREGESGSTGMTTPGGFQIGCGGSHVVSPFSQGSSSYRMSQTVNLGTEMNNRGSGGQSSGVVFRHNNCESSLGSSSQVGEESSSGPGSSLAGWGSSCKRKSLEGASGHSFPCEDPGCFVHRGLTQYDASSSLSLSIPSQSSPNISNHSGQSEPRYGAGGGRAVASNAFPSARNVDGSYRPGRRLNPGLPQESVPFSLSSDNVSSQQHLPVTSPSVDPLEVRSMTSIAGNSSSNESQSNIIHLPALTRNIHHFAWNAASSSRANNPLIPGERFGPPRAAPRSNSEHHMLAPATEMRNPMPDESIWSFSRGNPSVSGDSPFVPQAGPSSSIHSLHPNPAWIPPQSTSMHNPSRTSELAPWSLFSTVESESASRGGSLPLLPTGSSVPLNEMAAPSGSSSRSHRPRPRRLGLLLERQNDLHLRNLGRSLAADNDGRNRMISEIRQVLNAMRRGDNVRFEDYMVFDPLIFHGMAEMHDRHRDMRLDVDNMSYEELLALEERIGDVSTGLTEEVILKTMKQHKYTTLPAESQQDSEPCCICQEGYVEGDDIGTLDCGHEFHTDCIKQWVMLKNLCPICKTMALST
ncbi:PREDICTED: E3 ubiquitin-protein ligase MBR2 [Tarenaya hassleriana]|uniref:E3 ubiquitin-protein ligase MBR2 n=1 Tax=Tarenaya hassleriana TaxID=28532 RepID=UPI00053C1249|nr:PREDICTED: E3 ubiquitin-protein ligase MBR2 [Tarenaya hassleriana]XP_010530764.1 PREDICTED: E3 ubiquitin-protein ligase MBR2 [Tarenaya hassleriana]XP_010530765.1 PREDICTED: E3 ubiquitin-protein ligase MBR2 [Tarenaya hassleriana]XP_010530767.1 PREDICTED: E3 ubiquitin-protein ligase MBR2 [Tarenaya hassleriana]XP_010530768.1 PREDICTED: E3 ubiquitin-protein ligase MBR2 [Tarenaya hassleriana]XP_010530769.1 PREDICTED: E3 ubiquitin-protein ligase MBR2 [Tarenaya hassleriana]XP_019057422.1 PREDICTE